MFIERDVNKLLRFFKFGIGISVRNEGFVLGAQTIDAAQVFDHRLGAFVFKVIL